MKGIIRLLTPCMLFALSGPAAAFLASDRIEMAMERDFSAVDQKRLENAISAFFDALDGDG